MACTLSSILRLARFGLASVGATAALATTPLALAQDESPCGSLANAFGPFDYRTQRGESLQLVESAHFTTPIETLVRGRSGGASPAGDIDYTLRAYPNHHRALISVMRYGEKMKSPHPRDLRYSVECYFDRATRFKPDDPIVRMIFATFLNTNKRAPEALNQLEQATTLAKDNPFTHYNIGLIYLEMKVYDKALAQAHKAYGMGFTHLDLKNGLVAAGKWTEPPAPPAAEAPSPTAPASQ